VQLGRRAEPESDVLGHVPVARVLTQEVHLEAVQEPRTTKHVPAAAT